MTKPEFSNSQIIHQLTTSFSGAQGASLTWSGGAVKFSLADSAPTVTFGGEGLGFKTMTAHEKSMARLAFQEWGDLINLPLQEVSDPNAQITFGYTTVIPNTASGQTDTNPPLPVSVGGSNQSLVFAQVWMSANDPNDSSANVAAGLVGFTTYLHEIGHSLGLSHPGVYQASDTPAPTYATNAAYSRDTVQYSIMSYFNAGSDGDGASYQGGPSTPMIDDIMAIQSKYGANMSTRSDNTVYGFNTTITGAEQQIYDFTLNQQPILTIWDGGGVDTIDASGFSQDQRIDLRAGEYSDIGALKQNVGIAYNVTIENANGGSGNDILQGNSANNTLVGNGGADRLDGAGGFDTLIGGQGDDTYYLLDATFVETSKSVPGTTRFDAVTEAANGGTDTVDVMRATASSGATLTSYTLPTNVENGLVVGSDAFDLNGNSSDNHLTGNDAANTLSGGAGADHLYGAGGFDTLIGGQGGDTYTLNDANWRLTPSGAGTYVYAAQFDAVQEAADPGTDTVIVSRATAPGSGLFHATTLTSYTLGANVENGIVGGVGNFDLTGNSLDNSLTGNSSANVLTGGDGHDTLDGGDGLDTLIGGAGDDFYILRDVSMTQLISSTGLPTGVFIPTFDSVQELLNGGIDNVAVESSTTTDQLGRTVTLSSYTLGANVENGEILDTTLFDLTGNALANDLIGNSAVNTLTGLGGDDTIFGGGGTDTFVYSSLGFGHDRIQDFAAGSASGHDVMAISRTLASSFNDIMNHFAQIGANAVLTLDSNDVVTLDNVSVKTLVATDFKLT